MVPVSRAHRGGGGQLQALPTKPWWARTHWEIAKWAKRIVRFWGGGGCTIKCPLQNHEIGTICQIGVFFGETVLFFPRRSFSTISHYVFNECRQVLYLSPKMALFGPKRCSFLLVLNANSRNGARFTHVLKCYLQHQFSRPQKMGFVWSVSVSSKETDRA